MFYFRPSFIKGRAQTRPFEQKVERGRTWRESTLLGGRILESTRARTREGRQAGGRSLSDSESLISQDRRGSQHRQSYFLEESRAVWFSQKKLCRLLCARFVGNGSLAFGAISPLRNRLTVGSARQRRKREAVAGGSEACGHTHGTPGHRGVFFLFFKAAVPADGRNYGPPLSGNTFAMTSSLERVVKRPD